MWRFWIFVSLCSSLISSYELFTGWWFARGFQVNFNIALNGWARHSEGHCQGSWEPYKESAKSEAWYWYGSGSVWANAGYRVSTSCATFNSNAASLSYMEICLVSCHVWLINCWYYDFRGNSLRDAASAAYAQVFAPHHGWAIRKAVAAGMYALPSKSQLLKKLNEDGECPWYFFFFLTLSVLSNHQMCSL